MSAEKRAELLADPMGKRLLEAGDRYPRGAERTAIDGAFDTLVANLKTEPGEDGNVRLFSLDEPAARPAANLKEARTAATKFVGKPIENNHGLPPATVSGGTLSKMLSDSAVRKSTSPADHVLAVANLDTLYRIGMLDQTHADSRGEPTIAAIHRVVAPMIGADGDVLAVKMTVKETTHPGTPNPLYSVQTLEVDSTEEVKPARKAPQSGIEREPGQNRNSPQAGFSADVTRMLADFKHQHAVQFSQDGQAHEPFYSALTRAVDTAKGAPKAGDAKAWAQWMGGAQRRGKFKQDERGTDANTDTDQATPAQEAHRVRIERIADIAKSVWQGDDVPALRVVATPEQLPLSARRDKAGQFSNAYKRAAGMYDGKTIWIVASRHGTDAEGLRKLLTTMAHEGVGHYGVDRIVEHELGKAAWKKIESATERLRADPTLASPAIREVLDELDKRYAGADPTTYAREFLAVTSERGVKNSLLDRVITALRHWVRRMGEALQNHAAPRGTGQRMADLRVSEHELRQLLVKSDQYLRGSESQQRGQSRASMAFSLQSFAEQVRNMLAGGDRRGSMLDMGRVAAVLRMAGLSDLPLRMPPSVLFKVASGKGGVRAVLTQRQITQLPEKLDEPVAVFHSSTETGSYVVLTDMKDAKGNPVMVAIKPNGRDAMVNVHVLTSAYGKDRPEQLGGKNAVYWDKEKALNLLGSDAALFREVDPRSQGPAQSVLTPDDLRKFRIQERERALASPNNFNLQRHIDTDTPAFKRWFGQSKVVDVEGSPLPVYHGTAEEFEAFDPARSGSVTAHMTANLGTFFAEDRAKAQRYAENASQGVPAEERVIDAYLSIQKPYIMSLDEFMAIDSQEESSALRKKLQSKGFDGIHFKEVGQWIAFQPTQIKSASENRGTFDPNDPRINFSLDDDADPDNPRPKRKARTDAAESIEAIEETLPNLDRKPLQHVKDWISGKARDLELMVLGALQLRHVRLPHARGGASVNKALRHAREWLGVYLQQSIGSSWPNRDAPSYPAEGSSTSRSWLLAFRRRAAVTHRVRVRMARCSTRGPCAAVRRGRQAPQGESARCRFLFASTWMCCRKARPRLTDLPPMATAWMPELRQRRSGCPMGGKRQAGWPSLLVTYLLLRASCPPPFGPATLFAHVPDVCVATQEISNSDRVAARNALALQLLR